MEVPFLGPGQGGIWPETGFNVHAEWGLPKPRSGKDAMRTYAMEKDAHTQVYQDVSVLPQTPYRASVWVQGVDLHGKGFGTHAGDSAGLCLIEMDAAGKASSSIPSWPLPRPAITRSCRSVYHDGRTAKVRFLLDTVIGCQWRRGARHLRRLCVGPAGEIGRLKNHSPLPFWERGWG